jgi:hypothetical protein
LRALVGEAYVLRGLVTGLEELELVGLWQSVDDGVATLVTRLAVSITNLDVLVIQFTTPITDLRPPLTLLPHLPTPFPPHLTLLHTRLTHSLNPTTFFSLKRTSFFLILFDWLPHFSLIIKILNLTFPIIILFVTHLTHFVYASLMFGLFCALALGFLELSHFIPG